MSLSRGQFVEAVTSLERVVERLAGSDGVHASDLLRHDAEARTELETKELCILAQAKELDRLRAEIARLENGECVKCNLTSPLRETCAYPEACKHPGRVLSLLLNQEQLLAATLTQRVKELERYLAAASQRHANIFAEYYARAGHELLLEEVKNLKQLLLTEQTARQEFRS